MSYIDERDETLFPVRNGGAAGTATERVMLQSLDWQGGLASFRTKIITSGNTKTTLRTKGGMPEFVTVKNAPEPVEPVEPTLYRGWPWHGIYSASTNKVTNAGSVEFTLPGVATPSNCDAMYFSPSGTVPRNVSRSGQETWGNYISTGGNNVFGRSVQSSVIVSDDYGVPYIALFDFRKQALTDIGVINPGNYALWRFHEIKIDIYPLAAWIKAMPASAAASFKQVTAGYTEREMKFSVADGDMPQDAVPPAAQTIMVSVEVPWSRAPSDHSVDPVKLCEITFIKISDATSDGRKIIISWGTVGSGVRGYEYNLSDVYYYNKTAGYGRMEEGAWTEISLQKREDGSWGAVGNSLSLVEDLYNDMAGIHDRATNQYGVTVNQGANHTERTDRRESIIGYAYLGQEATPVIATLTEKNTHDRFWVETGDTKVNSQGATMRSLDVVSNQTFQNTAEIILSFGEFSQSASIDWTTTPTIHTFTTNDESLFGPSTVATTRSDKTTCRANNYVVYAHSATDSFHDVAVSPASVPLPQTSAYVAPYDVAAYGQIEFGPVVLGNALNGPPDGDGFYPIYSTRGIGTPLGMGITTRGVSATNSPVAGPVNTVHLQVQRMCDKAFALVLMVRNMNITENNQITSVTYSQQVISILTPKGVTYPGTLLQGSTLTASDYLGSVNPLTGEVVQSRSGIVCWV